MKLATLYKKLPQNQVQCTACSWYCRIKPESLGVCATRFNQKGKLYSLVYGKAIGLHLDPVEKKPLYHFFPGSRILSFGTIGCNFGCLFCQNYHMSQINRDPDLQNSLLNLDDQAEKSHRLVGLINQLSTPASPREIVHQAINSNAQGIAYTYNEPAIFAEYAHDTMVLAQKQGLKNIYVSNGFESRETFEYLKKYLDAINIDLKSFRNDFYRQICFAKIGPVKVNIKKFFAAGIHTEVTTLIIPGHNDSTKELTQIVQFLVDISPDIPWHISAYYPTYKMTTPPTPIKTLLKAYNIGKKAGLNYIYVGNVNDPRHGQTLCPKCHSLLIERFGYETQIDHFDPTSGTCQKCGAKIYGVYS